MQTRRIPEEAETVRTIFELYLSGLGKNAIVKKLTELGLQPKHGGVWRESVISAMLRNEKYKGDLLMQKNFVFDHISKKTLKNNGELPRYYVEGYHEPIISPELFDRVQEEIRRRAEGIKQTPAKTYPFTGKIVCEKCGKHFRRKVLRSGAKWSCSTYDKLGRAHCDAQMIPEPALQAIVEDRPFRLIRVPENGTVIVDWEDGSESEHDWQNPPRSSYWTEEMRHAAAERTRQWHQRNQ